MTTEQRKELVDAKKKQIIAYIAANAINPQTKLPHPPLRIELALEEGKSGCPDCGADEYLVPNTELADAE